MIFSWTDQIDDIPKRHSMHRPAPIATPTDTASAAPVRISSKGPCIEEKGRTGTSTVSEIPAGGSIITHFTIAASEFIHDTLDDYGYPQAISMSQMSMTPDDKQIISDRAGMNLDGNFSKPVSTGTSFSPIFSMQSSPYQDVGIHSKAAEYFDDLKWKETQSRIHTIDGKEFRNRTRRKALTFCKIHNCSVLASDESLIYSSCRFFHRISPRTSKDQTLFRISHEPWLTRQAYS